MHVVLSKEDCTVDRKLQADTNTIWTRVTPLPVRTPDRALRSTIAVPCIHQKVWFYTLTSRYARYPLLRMGTVLWISDVPTPIDKQAIARYGLHIDIQCSDTSARGHAMSPPLPVRLRGSFSATGLGSQSLESLAQHQLEACVGLALGFVRMEQPHNCFRE